MASARCLRRHGWPSADSANFQDYVLPAGYPHTALLCEVKGCRSSAVLWLTDEEVSAYNKGQRIFSVGDGDTKVRTKNVSAAASRLQFAEIWARIARMQRHRFTLPDGQDFTYIVEGRLLKPQGSAPVKREHIKSKWELYKRGITAWVNEESPLHRFIYAILSDERIAG